VAGSSHIPTIQNRRARHEYHVDDTYEAGIALKGCEVKSIRAGNASLSEAYAKVENGEVWLVGMYVKPYRQAGENNPPPTRQRKLLLKRSEIRRLRRDTEQRGYTLIPLKLYFRRGMAKLELGLCRGKRLHDKRDAIRERDLDRQAQRELVGRHED
jgi:SsrA-binding protein